MTSTTDAACIPYVNAGLRPPRRPGVTQAELIEQEVDDGE